MQLTSEQSLALDRIAEWRKDPDQWFMYLGGYAGTGKTTLMHHYINSLEEAPLCLAPTGKAASVLQKKLKTAVVTTIHSALYKPVIPDISKLEELELKLKANPTAGDLLQEIREEKQRLARLKLRFTENEGHAIVPGDLVIIDESSMVTAKMMDDLERTEAKVLFVGDPGQLPPVGDSGFFCNTQPDAMLSQVMRQALDNPIVALSMHIRNGRNIPAEIDNEFIQRRDRNGFDIAELGNYDQILTGKNAIRRKLNRIARKLLGRHENVHPVEGEKLICLKNTHKRDDYLINGVQCFAASDASVNNFGDWQLDLLYEGNVLNELAYYHYPFEVHYNYGAEEDPWPSRKHLVELDYGYAITVHKSQGSEWDKVALVDDFLMGQDREFRKRWLYTAVTRAKKQLLWIDME